MLALLCVICILLTSSAPSLHAQELRATVRISTDALGSVDKSRYQSLENQILNLLNTTKWSNLRYAPNERIVCSFALNLLEVDDEVHHRAELSVTASRTVYNTNYTTTTFVFRDKDLNFDYASGDRLEFSPQNIDNSLSATLALYAMLIISVDLDSYASLGGDVMKTAINSLINTASTQPEWQGWKSMESDNNRASLAEKLLDTQSQQAREAWYTYHLKGLDQCSRQIEDGRRHIITSLISLKEWKQTHYRSPLLSLWETAKVEELTKLFELAPREERSQVYNILLDLFPTRTDLFNKLKQ